MRDVIGIGVAQVRFGVFFEPHKTTSGQRFFRELRDALEPWTVPLQKRPDVILFNISAPLAAIIRARLRRQRVVLRVDGVYLDRLSPAFLATLPWPLRSILRAGIRWPKLHDACAFVANLLNRNYGTFARMLLADVIVYQSEFSRALYSRWFPGRYSRVIINGTAVQSVRAGVPLRTAGDPIRLVTIHDEWRPSKRIHDVVAFVRWAREVRGVPLELTILGYRGSMPACAPAEATDVVERSEYIRPLSRFETFSGAHREALSRSDAYLTFTFRDACPNAVVEAMGHGLPVVGVASGGVPEIVGAAGELIPTNDFVQGWYSSHRYECDFPSVDREAILQGILAVVARPDEYRARVAVRVQEELNIARVAERYAAAVEAAFRRPAPSDAEGRVQHE